MNSALVFLLVRSARGRVVRALRLLRQPKYIIGALGFIAWLALSTMGLWLDWLRGEDVSIRFGAVGALGQLAPEMMAAVQLLTALVLTLVFTIWWILPWGGSSLDLEEEELHILTPAPVKRRDLIQYAVLRSQAGVLFGSLMMTVFLAGGGLARRALWFAGIWLMLTNWDLHSKGRALWNAKQAELPPPRAVLRRSTLVGTIVVFWLVLAVVINGLVGDVLAWRPPPDVEIEQVAEAALAELGPLLRQSPLPWLLLPLVWVTEPLFLTPESPLTAILPAYLPPALLLVAQNEWVVRSQTRFEETALAHVRKKARQADATSRYWKTSLLLRRTAPFPLAPAGGPEMAIWWKNLLQIHRWPLAWSLALGALACLTVGVVPPLVGAPGWVYGLFFGVAIFLLLMSPAIFGQTLRNDLRMDLPKFEVVRAWPIRGWRLVAAQIAGPATLAMLGALLGAGLLLAVDLGTTLGNVRLGENDDVLVMAWLAELLNVPHVFALPLVFLGLMPVLTVVAILSASIANMAALVFPGWIQLGPQAGNQGAAHFGQNIVLFFGLGLALLVATLPAVLLVGVVLLVQILILGIPLSGWELPALGVVATTPMAVAAALIIRAGGGLWDRLDPSREILETGG